jgi:hypothetical protein
MRSDLLMTPRPLPGRLAPVLAGAFVILVALPIFLIAHWRISGWALGAALWAASQALNLLLSRFKLGLGNLAASGVVGVGRMFRAIGVMVVIIAVAISDANLALAAALLYALAYTFELSVALVTYFGAER